MWPFKQTERYDQPLPDLYERILSGANVVDAFSDLSTSMTLAQSMQALLQGGFPEPVLGSETNSLYQAQWMDNYIANYINRDIRGLIRGFQSTMATQLEYSYYRTIDKS